MKNENSSVPLLLLFLFFITGMVTNAQVKIGDNPNTINPNSLLEMESTNKGILPPRVAINSLTSVAPLTGTVPAGMLVYSSGGSVADGYYYWNGSGWNTIGKQSMVAKTANATLTKTETFIIASNNITLTLPASPENGLAITIKHNGATSDLVVVKGSAGTTIDGFDSTNLTRWHCRTFVAYNGNWITNQKVPESYNVYEVSPTGSWTTMAEVLSFLSVHMRGPSVIKLGAGDYTISTTQTINLPYPLTIQGTSYGKTSISPGGSFGPLFIVQSETYFKMLAFTGTVAHGGTINNDAIQFTGTEEYYEIKDCSFSGFNKTLNVKSNAELWVFEVDVDSAVSAGIEVAAGASSGATLKVSEVDFTACSKGIFLNSGTNATISILNSTFYNATGGTGLDYNPTNFTNFSSMFITNNAWNGIGTFFNGFDFSRTDGRDAKAFLQNNAGDPNRNPSCYINVQNNATNGTLTNANTWYKATWNHAVTSTSTTKWTVANSSGNVNRITYQPTNKRSGYFIITGSLSCNNSSRTISISVFKNGNTAVRFGESTVRTGTSGTATVFSFIVFIPELSNGDYFEIGLSSTNGGDVITIQDLQWIVDTK